MAELTGVHVLADAPTEGATSRIPVARLGNYRDNRYGAFSITREDYDGWKRNLADSFNGEVPIDFDHSPEKGKGTEAAGWIKDLHVDGQHVLADVEWTDKGAEAIRTKRYRYISPTFLANAQVEGRPVGRALIGAGLTNRPFLRRDMPAISLSDEPPAFAELESEASSDSRPRMPELTKIAQALKLDDDADEATVLEAVTALNEKAEKPAEPTPEPGADGVITLSAERFAELETKANAGQAAAKELAEMRFTTAWDKAIDEGRVAPAQEDNFKALYEANADLCVQTLDGLAPIVSTEAKGGGAPPAAGDTVDAERAELDQAAKALAAEKNISYEEAVFTLEDQEVAA